MQAAGSLAMTSPALEPGLKLERAAVLGDGVFEPGYLLKRNAGDPGTPVSGLIAGALAKADGVTTIAAICDALASSTGANPAAVGQAVESAFRLLYIDGIVREMRTEA
jgi:hypothetical protein